MRIGAAARAIKIIARYQQVEAVEALVDRAKDDEKRQGLIWQHQGSGKTFLMAFACGKLRRDVPGATVLVVLDRLDLIEQTTREFQSAGVKRVRSAETKTQLQQMLGADQRGVIITTVFRFKDAGLLTERDDVVVLIDEAHRTQEGTLGMDMRAALPNATYIGMTGTPISERDRDTYERFGDKDDPGWVINAYTPERSMADGATLPLRVEAPRPDLQLDKEALDAAFDEMAEEEGLTEAEKEQLAKTRPLRRRRSSSPTPGSGRSALTLSRTTTGGSRRSASRPRSSPSTASSASSTRMRFSPCSTSAAKATSRRS